MKKAKKYCDMFLGDLIDVEVFWDLFNENKSSAKRYQPWSTKEWKDKRALILKDSCECCGSKENLIIQHGWRPKKFWEHSQIAKKSMESNGKILFGRWNLSENPEKSVDGCPECGSINFHQLKSGEFKCYNQERRKTIEYREEGGRLQETHHYLKVHEPPPQLSSALQRNTLCFPLVVMSKEKCGTSFKSPVKYIRPETMQEYAKRRNLLNESLLKEIKTIATKNWIMETIKYQNLENTSTYCKACAYEEDKKLGFIQEDE